MSSVVNKSKNKFVPKAKARPRPGVIATVSHPKPPEEPITVAPPEVREKTPTPLPTPPPTLPHPEPEIAEPLGPRGGAPILLATAPVIREGSEERHSEPRQRSVVPTLRTIGEEEDYTESPLRSQGIPIIRSASGIPSIRSSTAPIPAIRTTSGPEDPEENHEGPKSKVSRTRLRNKEKTPVGGADEAEIEEVGDEGSGEESGPKTKRKPVTKRKAKTTPGGEPATKRKPQTRKKKIVIEGDDVEGDAADQAEGEASTAKSKKKRAPKRAKEKRAGKPRGRRRAESPEDGESQEIATNVVKMKDLCKDMKIGKKSKRFLELQQADWTRLAKGLQDKQDAGAMVAGGEGGEVEEDEGEVENETVQEKLDRLERLAGERNRKAMNTPQMRIVNGQIVLDDESLQIDRRERDAVDEGVMEIIEENQSSRRVTSQTWSKREKVEKWDAAQTEKFYEALSMFGTDFEIISKMFVGRSRRQMRNKFNNEERRNPKKITEALRTRIAVNIEEYSVMADQEFQDPQELEDELQKLRDEHEAEEVAAVGHAVAAERERQEAANAAMHEGDNAVAIEQGKKTRKKKGAKGALGPGQEEVLMSREEYEQQRVRELALAEEL